jgi:hypothetical protein
LSAGATCKSSEAIAAWSPASNSSSIATSGWPSADRRSAARRRISAPILQDLDPLSYFTGYPGAYVPGSTHGDLSSSFRFTFTVDTP